MWRIYTEFGGGARGSVENAHDPGSGELGVGRVVLMGVMKDQSPGFFLGPVMTRCRSSSNALRVASSSALVVTRKPSSG